MAVTTQRSTQVTYAEDGKGQNAFLDPATNVGAVHVASFDFTQSGAGDATSTVDLVVLPSGRKKILAGLSRIAWSAFGASRTLDVGYLAHTQTDGTAVVADPNGLDATVNVASAGGAIIGTAVGNDQAIVLNSNAPVKVQATVAGGTIPDGATLNGHIAYVLL